jgi:hypothetical protein
MPAQKCEKPASALGAEPASSIERLGGAFDLINSAKSARPQAAAESRRLVGARYSAALPDTVLAAALLKALRRRAGVA